MATLAFPEGGLDRTRRRLAWALPVIVAGAVAAGVALSTAGASSASPTLRPQTAAQLLVAVQGSAVTALSGEIRESANLGLPSLPGDQSSASLSWQSFVTGSHSARVWADGPDKQRVALLGELSEADVVHNGQDVWTYTSDTNTVTHTVLQRRTENQSAPSASDYTPAEAAARVLKAIAPSTAVSIDASRMVAGRPAYTLTLRPRDARSTVRKVMIAIDASKSVPLRVQVFGAGPTAAFETGFTKISFATPRASIFAFHQPTGASVATDPFGMHSNGHRDRRESAHRAPVAVDPARASVAPKLIGSGWTSVVELSGGLGAGVAGGTLGELTSTVGNSGQRLLHTALINAVFLPDGRVFVGAVSPGLLEHIAATTPR